MKTRLTPIMLSAFAALLSVSLTIACSQDTIAQLVSTLGNASASVAKLEGDTVLADKLTTDTAAAVTAIQNWKSGGTPAQIAIQALNIVLADLNLFPGTSQYAPLIALAVTTAESIIAILSPPASAARAKLNANAPQNAAAFRSRWNQIALSNNAMAGAVIR